MVGGGGCREDIMEERVGVKVNGIITEDGLESVRACVRV